MLPLQNAELTIGKSEGSAGVPINVGDVVILKGVRDAIAAGATEIPGLVWCKECGKVTEVTFSTGDLTDDERQIILAGGLVGYYRQAK